MLGPDRRVAIVNEHMRHENAHDFPMCIAEFGHPRYEVLAEGEVFDGSDRVNQFLSENRKAFPDFVFEPTRVSPTPDAVLVEGRFVEDCDGQGTGVHRAVHHGFRPVTPDFCSGASASGRA